MSALDVAKERDHNKAVAVVEQLMGSAIAGLSAGALSQALFRRSSLPHEVLEWAMSRCVAASAM